MSTLDDILAKCDHLVATGLWPREQEFPYHRWIQNFPQGQQLAAAKLLSHLIYVNEEMVHGALATAYQRLVRSLTPSITNATQVPSQSITTSHRSIVVTPIRGESPNAADSALTYMRTARDELGLNQNQLVDDLSIAVRRATSSDKVLVLIDDVVGSGNQLVSTIQDSQSGTASPKKMMDEGHTVACLVVAITSCAYLRLRKEYPKLQIFAGHILDVEHYSVRSLLPVADHPDAHDLLRTTAPLLQVPEYIRPDRAYGFKNIGLTVVFHNSIPDFTLPIFWARNGKDWVPLKERYHD